MIFLFGAIKIFSQTIINTWEGTSSEDVHYKYTLNVNFNGVEEACVNIYILKNFDTPMFSQIIKSHTINYSIEPIKATTMKDNDGNEYIKAEWTPPIDSVKVILEANLIVSTTYGHFFSSTHYPIESELIPDSIQMYLQPTGSCQSEAPEMVCLADSLVSNSMSEVDAVIKIINWVRYNMKWICTCSMPFVYGDALNTFYYGGGNCVNFGNLSIALLRAAGIPARKIFGPMIHDWTASCGHQWVEVYYPDKGWIQYETSYWMPNEGSLPWTFLIPRHIKTYSGSGIGITTGYAVEEHYTSTIITSSPSSIQTHSISIDTSNFITHCITIRNNRPTEADTVLLTTFTSSNNWQVSLSQDSIYFDPYNPWGDTRDAAITIAPPQNITGTDIVTVVVTATSQNTGLVEQLIYSIKPNFSKIEDITLKNLPTEFALLQNYPNPFNAKTNISFDVPYHSHVQINILNVRGQFIQRVMDENLLAGKHKIVYDASLLTSGIYFLQIKTDRFTKIKKMLLLK